MTEPVDAEQPAGHVELLIFSGRPNPTWDAEAKTIDLLEKILRKPATGELSEPFSGRLGYSGFRVVIVTGDSAPRAVIVAGGRVLSGEGALAEYWIDRAGIERHLLSEAREHGWAGLIEESSAATERESVDDVDWIDREDASE